MRLTIYRQGKTHSLEPDPAADLVLLEVPNGTTLGRFGRLGLVAFVPDGVVSMLHEGRDLVVRAHGMCAGFRLWEVVPARYREVRGRVEKLAMGRVG